MHTGLLCACTTGHDLPVWPVRCLIPLPCSTIQARCQQHAAALPPPVLLSSSTLAAFTAVTTSGDHLRSGSMEGDGAARTPASSSTVADGSQRHAPACQQEHAPQQQQDHANVALASLSLAMRAPRAAPGLRPSLRPFAAKPGLAVQQRRSVPTAAHRSSEHAAVVERQQHQQQRQNKQERFRAWQVPLAAALLVASIARVAVSHLKVAVHKSPPNSETQPGSGKVLRSLLTRHGYAGRPGQRDMPADRSAGIVWFRNDLRLHDHEPLAAANAQCTAVIPVYCFDPREYDKSSSGFHKTGVFRARFIIEALHDLRSQLQAAGSNLLIRTGRPEEVLPQLAAELGAGRVYCHGGVAGEDLEVEDAVSGRLEGQKAGLVAAWGGTLFHVEDLPFGLEGLPSSYGDFRAKVAGLPVREAVESPSKLKGLPSCMLETGNIPSLQDLGFNKADLARSHSSTSVIHLHGGEQEALRQLEAVAADLKARVSSGMDASSCNSSSSSGACYSDSAEDSADEDAAGFTTMGASKPKLSFRLSPWLAMGCLSPREMHQRLCQECQSLEHIRQRQQPEQEPSVLASHMDLSPLLFERDFITFLNAQCALAVIPPGHSKGSPRAGAPAFAMA